MVTTQDLPAIDLDEALQRLVLSSVRPTATALVGTFLVFFVFNLIDLPAHAVVPVAICDLFLVVAFATIRLLARRDRISPTWAHPVLVGMAWLVVFNILLTFALLREPGYTTYVLIIVIGGGFLLLSTGWLVVALSGIALGWAVVAWLFTPPRQFINFGFTMFGATVMATLVHVVRIRTVRRLEILRIANERRKQELEQALGSVEHELKERRRAESRYRDLVQGIDAIVWEAKASPWGWRFTFVSDYAARVLGLEPARWLEVDDFWLERVHVDDRQRARAFCRHWSLGGADLDTELECRATRADGDTVWTRLVVSGVLDTDGEGRQLRGLIFDISRQKQAEEERRQLEQQYQQSQKMEAIGTLAGGVAHDINNILGAIMGLASLTKEELPPKSRERRDVEDILTACRRGHDLTRNLLGFARQGQYRKVNLSLNETVRDVAELLERTSERRVAVVQDLDPELAEINGDPSQLNHALLNVAVNAVDAMRVRDAEQTGKGTLTLTTQNVELSGEDLRGTPDLLPGRYVSVAVSDTGMGMDATTKARAFEPFFTTKGPGEGTGLGLSMVYGSVQKHGGRVFIASEPGQGTTVTLQFPAAPPRPPDHARPAADAAPLAPQRSVTVLLVDDEPLIQASARRLLERLGHRVLVARDGREAWELFRERYREVDLVILDMLMPVMDGAECYERLRAVDPGLKVIFTSGHETGRLDTADASGCEYLQKPYGLDELSAAMVRLLRGV